MAYILYTTYTEYKDIDLSDISWKPHLNHFLLQVFIHHSGCALLQPVYDSQRRTMKM